MHKSQPSWIKLLMRFILVALWCFFAIACKKRQSTLPDQMVQDDPFLHSENIVVKYLATLQPFPLGAPTVSSFTTPNIKAETHFSIIYTFQNTTGTRLKILNIDMATQDCLKAVNYKLSFNKKNEPESQTYTPASYIIDPGAEYELRINVHNFDCAELSTHISAFLL